MNREERVYLVIDTEQWGSRTADTYQGTAGPVPLVGADDIADAAQPIWDAGKKPVLLVVDPQQAEEALREGQVVGPLPLAAVVRAAPLRPDGRGGFTHRDPTPMDHTLYGVLTRVQLEDPDPALQWKLNQAYAKRYEWLRSKCARQLWGFSDAAIEELVQDVLVVSWRDVREQYRPDESFQAFLAGIALNVCRAARRKRKDELLGDDELLGQLEPLGGTSLSVLEKLEWAERDRLVAEAVRAVLDPLDQEIALLRYKDDLPFEEIARLKGLPGGVKDVHAAMMRIRRRLAPELHRRLAALEPG